MLRPWKTVIQIDFDQSPAVYLQIANSIITEIKKGRLPAGAALPGSRILAADLEVNRKTVVLAYEALLAEGWVETTGKRGTFVSAQLPQARAIRKRAERSFDFNTYDSIISDPVKPRPGLIVFNDGLPDVRLTPVLEMAKAYRRILQQKTRSRMLGYSHVQGEERLRRAISLMLAGSRGLHADHLNLCITRGSQMALYLTIRILINPGDQVAMECPGYLPAWQTFHTAGANIINIPVDDKGIDVEFLERVCQQTKIKAVYVTPHHQFPTTATLKIDRRLQLIALSNRYRFAIIEDDYDFEYHFESKSMLPLASYEQAANVIYIGSFSKLLAPAVRVGYISGPAPFIASLAQLRAIVDRQGDTIMEHTIAELLETGDIHRHARRAYSSYKERRELMDQYLEAYLGNKVSYRRPEGGLAYWVNFTSATDTGVLSQKLLAKGVYTIPTERFAFDGRPTNALRLGYASLTPEEMEQGIRIIAASLPRQ